MMNEGEDGRNSHINDSQRRAQHCTCSIRYRAVAQWGNRPRWRRIVFNGTDFRLQGIDALEEDQSCTDKMGAAVPCGRIAKAELDAILKGERVECRPTGQRDGKRAIGQCFASGVSVEYEMVRRGWAFVRPDFATERTAELCQIEHTAAASNLGAWALKFERPYFFRGGRKKTFQQIACQHEYAR
jgi:endonuclease YncB( thermonuclease family)